MWFGIQVLFVYLNTSRQWFIELFIIFQVVALKLMLVSSLVRIDILHVFTRIRSEWFVGPQITGRTNEVFLVHSKKVVVQELFEPKVIVQIHFYFGQIFQLAHFLLIVYFVPCQSFDLSVDFVIPLTVGLILHYLHIRTDSHQIRHLTLWLGPWHSCLRSSLLHLINYYNNPIFTQYNIHFPT